jgi:hypothetical protein
MVRSRQINAAVRGDSPDAAVSLKARECAHNLEFPAQRAPTGQADHVGEEGVPVAGRAGTPG